MFSIEEILEATGGKLIRGSLSKRVRGVSIDSRTISPNELFVAIKGFRFDGHDFANQAASGGAGAILISDACYKKTGLSGLGAGAVPAVRVKNTLQALGALACRHRKRFNIPVIAITGSNGKTTTKEMLSSVLQRKFNVLRNPGTQNSYIGVPLTILKLRKRHEIAVIEIGANHSGEIDRLSWMVRPTVGIITNIGPAHLKFLKNIKGVFTAKCELISNLARDGKLIINNDDQFLSQLKQLDFSIVSFGFTGGANFYAQIIRETEERTVFLLNKRHRITLRALGVHNVYNALAGIACARNFNLSLDEIKRGLALFKKLPMRMQLLKVSRVKIINDCYNSNPESLKSALEFLKAYSSPGKKIIVCGDMLELGKKAKRLHLDIGKLIAESEIDFLITVGRLAGNIACSAYSTGMPQQSIRRCNNTSEAAKLLRSFIRPQDVVLIKGSRAMQMENVLKCFTSSFTR